MGDRDQRKQSIYLPEPMLAELRAEAARTDRSLSWLIQRAWSVARVQIARLPSIDPADERARRSADADAEDACSACNNIGVTHTCRLPGRDPLAGPTRTSAGRPVPDPLQ